MTTAYTCEACGGEFETERSDEAANVEAEINFGIAEASTRSDMAIVCDDCYRAIMRWTRGETE